MLYQQFKLGAEYTFYVRFDHPTTYLVKQSTKIFKQNSTSVQFQKKIVTRT